jgi:hypothetical protein
VLQQDFLAADGSFSYWTNTTDLKPGTLVAGQNIIAVQASPRRAGPRGACGAAAPAVLYQMLRIAGAAAEASAPAPSAYPCRRCPTPRGLPARALTWT